VAIEKGVVPSLSASIYGWKMTTLYEAGSTLWPVGVGDAYPVPRRGQVIGHKVYRMAAERT